MNDMNSYQALVAKLKACFLECAVLLAVVSPQFLSEGGSDHYLLNKATKNKTNK